MGSYQTVNRHHGHNNAAMLKGVKFYVVSSKSECKMYSQNQVEK